VSGKTVTDARRSLARHLHLVLGDAWEVRFAEEGGTFVYPFALVARAGAVLSEGPQAWQDVTQPFVCHFYPQTQDSLEAAEFEAQRIEELLWEMIHVGRAGSYPMRLPFYDYAGLRLDQPSNSRNPHDYMRVVRNSDTIEPLPDPRDERRVAVVLNMRLTWRRLGRTITGTPVQSVRLRQTVEG
jgi:hypothetical protein